LEQLLARRLETESGAAAWSVQVSFTSRELPRVPTDFRDVSIDGWPAAEHARAPAGGAGTSRGRHALVACFDTDHGPVRVPFEAIAQPLVRVVVPVRDVERGDVLRPTDLELRFVPDTDASGRHVGRLEDAVGRQARQTARAGQPLESRSLVPPQLVKRRDTIEVSAARGAITVRRPVMALDDGALGDTITVETMDGTKTRFLARVVGTRMAEVFVSSASAGRQMPQ
jgi:flagella basal body P-ring formation protein FlgA